MRSETVLPPAEALHRSRRVSFEGYDFDANKVLAVDPINTYSTGNMSCLWQYGVKVRFEGAEILMLVPKDPNFGCAGCKTTRADLVRDAEALREKLIKLVWPSTP